MQSLVHHQRWLAALILEPERLVGGGIEAVGPVALDDVDVARERLGAYVSGYPVRLVEALEEAFPAVCTILGGDTFRRLADRYRMAVPVGVYSLGDVGVNLPAFLAGDPMSTALPFLGDLAALEWAWLRAFHAFERERFDPRSTAGWGLEEWARARLAFQPAVAVVRSRWPILDLWHLRDTSKEQRRRIDVVIEGRPQHVLVRREGLGVSVELVSPAKAGLLAELLSGVSLGEAMETLAETSDGPFDMTAWFAEWVTHGLVVDCWPG